MIVCKSCGKLNPEGFSFCLECGEELIAEDDAHSPESKFIIGLSANSEDVQRLRDEAEEMGVASVADKPGQEGGDAAALAAMPCPSCGAVLRGEDQFCPSCGARIGEEEEEKKAGGTMFMSVPQDQPKPEEAVGKIICLDPAGREGKTFYLGQEESMAGRSDGQIQFPDDRYISPKHCALFMKDGRFVVRDENSLNGVYLKLVGEREILSGQIFRCGQQLLQFVALKDFGNLPAKGRPEDQTQKWGSPKEGIWGKLLRRTRSGGVAEHFLLSGSAVTIGRERGDIIFPNDPFVSGQHMRISQVEGKYYLADLNSSNGSYLRLPREFYLTPNDQVLIGHKLMRIEY